MEAPKCKICGQKHYGLCKNMTVGFDTAAPNGDHSAHVIVEDGKVADVVLIPAGEKFDRLKYQREYMRKKRAKDKVK